MTMRLEKKLEELRKRVNSGKEDYCNRDDDAYEEMKIFEDEYAKNYKSALCLMIGKQIKVNEKDLSEKMKMSSEGLFLYKNYKLMGSFTKLRIIPIKMKDFDERIKYLTYFNAPGKIKLFTMKNNNLAYFWEKLALFINDNIIISSNNDNNHIH